MIQKINWSAQVSLARVGGEAIALGLGVNPPWLWTIGE